VAALERQQLATVIETTRSRILAHQTETGSFSFCCEVAPVSDAVMVIFLNLLGYVSDPLIPELCASLSRQQKPDGGWTAYPGQNSNNSITVLVYLALLISGVQKTAPLMMRARLYIQGHGGITQVSTFVKAFLAVSGELPWSILPEPKIELVLWEPPIPIHLFDIASPARLHLPSTLLLSHLNFAYHLPEALTLRELVLSHEELPKHRIPYANDRAIERCKTFLLERIEPDGTLAGYLSATVMMVFSLQALGYSSRHPIIRRAVAGLRKMVYRGKNFVHQQFFTSTVWDTAFSMQALAAAGVSPADDRMKLGANYLLRKQQRRVSDWIHHAPDAAPGGFGFSHGNTLYPDVDDTAAAVKALYPYSSMVRSRWKKAARWMLAMQNDDGGWSAFDRNCNNPLFEFLLGNDMDGTVTDPSTPDITGRVLEAIGSTRIRASGKVSRAVEWLLNEQSEDGSWFGRWGIAFIYGTFASTRGLYCSGVSAHHPSMQRALAWLLQIQNPDGGFGESCASDEQETFVPLKQSTTSQTAWALMAMLAASKKLTPQIEAAANYLIRAARPSGGWKETYPTGAGIAGQAYIRYHSYPYVWPLMALCAYREKWGLA
jgi:sporulenol synthase